MRRFMVIMLALLLAAGSTIVVAQTEFVTPGENLVVEGVSRIPVAMTEEIDRYTEFRYAGLSNWHPARTTNNEKGKVCIGRVPRTAYRCRSGETFEKVRS